MIFLALLSFPLAWCMKRPYSALLQDQKRVIVDLFTISAFSAIQNDLYQVPAVFEALSLDKQSLPVLHTKLSPYFEDDDLNVPSFPKTFKIWRQAWFDDNEHMFSLLSLVLKETFCEDPDLLLIMKHLKFPAFDSKMLDTLQSYGVVSFEKACNCLLSFPISTGRTLAYLLSIMPVEGCITPAYQSTLYLHPVINSQAALNAFFSHLEFEFNEYFFRQALHQRAPTAFLLEALEHCKPTSHTFSVAIFNEVSPAVALEILNRAAFQKPLPFMFKIAISRRRTYGSDFITKMCMKMPVGWDDELRDYAKKYHYSHEQIEEFAQLTAIPQLQ